MADQIINAAMAQAIQLDAVRTHPLSGWIVMRDPPDYPGKVIARLVTNGSTPYLLVADTLGGIHATLPAHLVRSDRQPVDLPEVLEVRFAT